MIVVFLSFQSIEIAYTDTPDTSTHLILSEKSPGMFEVIKQGIKIREFMNRLTDIKNQQMSQEFSSQILQSPAFVCFTAKSKKLTQTIMQALSPALEQQMLFVRHDKNEFAEVMFNRSLLIERDICYGQGYPQLRQKEELRLAVFSIFAREANIKSIFIEKHANQLKELKKQGFMHLVPDFDFEIFFNQYEAALEALKSTNEIVPEMINEHVAKYPFARKYLTTLVKTHKDVTIKEILPFNIKNITISGLFRELYRETNYYNISPKSWVPHQQSRQISSYIFHNTSDSQLYLASASRIRQLSNQEDYQVKILVYYLNFIINPSSFALPHDKLSSLMKFCKIKAYQNKKAYFNVRPYIEGLSTVSQSVSASQINGVFQDGWLRDRPVAGVSAVLLTSLLLNDNLNVKSLAEQTAFLGKNMSNQLIFLDKQSLRDYQGPLYLCRIDFHLILTLSNYKLINQQFMLSRKERSLTLLLKDINPSILNQMRQAIFDISEQKLNVIKSLTIYYRWNTKLVSYFELFTHRLVMITELLSHVTPFLPSIRRPFLRENSLLSCLLLDENYSYFLVPSKNLYSPTEYSYEPLSQIKKQPQNPYLTYITKVCSFAIYHISFPIHSFLQWLKATNKYQVIEYISMLNHSFEDYVVMDKRLKLITTNQKKNAILVVDHVQLCQPLINRPKSIKTVMIFRLRKVNEIEDVGMISSQIQKKDSLRQSDDELIKILIRQGSKQFSQQSQFFLFDWVFKTYIKIKCDLYNLNYTTALEFSSTLHKAICTNRHRIKEIKENHPKLHAYLYTLPIFKDGQKIVYNYRLFQYLHAYNLFDRIINKTWSCRLETYQNSSVGYWRSIIGVELATNITRNVLENLQRLEKEEDESYEQKEMVNDCLQLVRTLTETPNKEVCHLLPYSLYYEVFAEQVQVENYDKIIRILSNDKVQVVEDLQCIKIANFQDQQSLIIKKDQVNEVIASSFQQNYLYFLALASNSTLHLATLRIQTSPSLSYINQATFTFHNPIVLQIMKNSPLNSCLHVHKGAIFIIFHFQYRVILVNCSLSHPEEVSIKEYPFQQPVLKVVTTVSNTNQPYIIAITTQHSVTIALSSIFQDQPIFLKDHHFSLTEKTRITTIEKQGFDSQLIFFLNNQLEVISIASREVVQVQRFQLQNPIKSASLSHNLLFIFYESDDSLYLYRIHQHNCERLWRYYWTQPNSTELFPRTQTMIIKGGSYLKRIKIKNLQRFTHNLLPMPQ